MNLLIIGAGGHGYVVKEIAESVGIYNVISFVDDSNPIAVGKISDLEMLRNSYDSAFVSIGSNKLRKQFYEKLKEYSYCIPILIHSSACVSNSAKIAEGTIIEAGAIVNSNAKVGTGCIVSVGALSIMMQSLEIMCT